MPQREQVRRKPAGRSAPTKVPQPHGGALYAGGVPGHRGAGGRVPQEIRQRLRDDGYDCLPTLRAIADGVVTLPLRTACEQCGASPSGKTAEEVVKSTATIADRRAAIDTMLRYGIGTSRGVDPEVVQEKVRRTAALLRERLSPDTMQLLTPALREIWA